MNTDDDLLCVESFQSPMKINKDEKPQGVRCNLDSANLCTQMGAENIETDGHVKDFEDHKDFLSIDDLDQELEINRKSHER